MSKLLYFIIFSSLLFGEKFTTKEAWDHVGEEAKVCGKVVSVYFSKRSKGRPTFINLDKPYPNQLFTVVVWEEDRAKFQELKKLKNSHICVEGEIESYGEKPQMTLRDPSQLSY